MSFSYKPLWKLLVDQEMTKEELRQALGFSSSTMAKMSKGEKVSMDVLEKICKHFNCRIENVVEFVNE